MRSIVLPTDNRKQELSDGSYLYASNAKLDELLPNLDLFFKLQELRSDRDGQLFEYPEGKSSHGKIQQCVEFKYFLKDELVARFTLLPQDAHCYAEGEALQRLVTELYSNYSVVYAVERTGSN